MPVRAARCGSTDPHRAHWAHRSPRWCAGNLDIVTAVPAEPCLGCAWDAYTLRSGELSHLHDDAEDGPRAGCCEHTH